MYVDDDDVDDDDDYNDDDVDVAVAVATVLLHSPLFANRCFITIYHPSHLLPILRSVSLNNQI